MPQWPTSRTSHQEWFIGKVLLLEKKENGTKLWKEGEVKGGEGGEGGGGVKERRVSGRGEGKGDRGWKVRVKGGEGGKGN